MSNEHTVKSYEEELQFLVDSVIKMGSLTESQMVDSMDAIIKVDKDSIDKIIKSDDEINKFRSKIDTQIMTLLVKRAPMAIDLRETISSLKISQDLERIGDLSPVISTIPPHHRNIFRREIMGKVSISALTVSST